MARDEIIFQFGLCNPEAEPESFSSPKLLRRTADVIDELGVVDVVDLMFGSEATAEGNRPMVTVYYTRPESLLRSGGA